MNKVSLAIGAAVISLGAGQAMAQTLSPADKTFVTEAASGGHAEVALGQLAEKNGDSQEVKTFGQRMVTDHSKANQELASIAQQQNMTIPTKPSSADEATAQRLQAMKGSAFDKAYMQDMVQDHEKDIGEFQKEAQSGQDPAVKAFAQKYLPVLQQHLQMAKSVTTK